MLTGRLLMGAGGGSLFGKKSHIFCHRCHLRQRSPLFSASYSVLQDRVTAFWFKEKELAMAYGMTLGISRLGAILNFFVTQIFEQAYGLQWTLWGGRSTLTERRRAEINTQAFDLQACCCVFLALEWPSSSDSWTRSGSSSWDLKTSFKRSLAKSYEFYTYTVTCKSVQPP